MKEFYRYVRVDGKPVGTLVAVIEEGQAPKFGVAVCSDKDQFSKKKGRELALRGALNEQVLYYVPKKYLQPMIDGLHQFAQQVFSRNENGPIGNIPHIKYRRGEGSFLDFFRGAFTMPAIFSFDVKRDERCPAN